MNENRKPNRKRRKGRRVWIFFAWAALLLGAWIGYQTLRMPVSADLREIVPGQPQLLLEVRDAKQTLPQLARAAEPLRPHWQPILDRHLQSETEKETTLEEIAQLLGSDAALALYPSENDEPRWLLAAKTSPLARLQLGWNFRSPWWKKEYRAQNETIGGRTALRIDGLATPLYAAFDGRLGFAASHPDLLEEALRRAPENAFLPNGTAALAARLDEQPDDRSVSFYWAAAPEASALGSAQMESDRWSGRVWVDGIGGSAAPSAGSSDFRRGANRLLSQNAALAAWHAAVPDRAVLDAARAIGLRWRGGVDESGSRAIGIYLPKQTGTGGLLPPAALFAEIEDAPNLLDDIDDARLSIQRRRLQLNNKSPYRELSISVAPFVQYPLLKFGASDGTLAASANADLVKQMLDAFQQTPGKEPLAADLFRLRAYPKEAVYALRSLEGPLELLGASEDPLLTSIADMMDAMRLVEAAGFSAPNGFAADIEIVWDADL